MGIQRTPKQIEAAFEACRRLELAYARASEDNGGNSVVRWQDIDAARDAANEALTHDEYIATVNQACTENGCNTYEFKRSDDTEGGTCD